MLEDKYALFRKKYIKLRDLYGLDNKLVTQYGNLIYNNHLGKGNLPYWADGRRRPSVDGIFTLAALFAVSPFWLGKKTDTDDLDLSNAYSLLQVEGLEEVTSLDVITSEDEVEGGTTEDPSPKILFTHSG